MSGPLLLHLVSVSAFVRALESGISFDGRTAISLGVLSDRVNSRAAVGSFGS